MADLSKETGFTPGPWSTRRAHLPTDGEFDFAVTALIEGRSLVISEAFGRCAYDVVLPAEANARLIAAAPELYEALKGLLGGVLLTQKAEHYPSDDPINKAIAALAKARGEQQS